MTRFFNCLYIMSALLAVSGCASLKSAAVRPEPQPLVRELVSTSEVTEKVDLAEPSGSITLLQAHKIALIKNPELRSYSFSMRAAESRALQASLLTNPELEVEVEEFEFGGSSSNEGHEMTISLSQLFELGGKRQKRQALMESRSQLAGLDYQAARLDVFLQTTLAFIDVLAAQRSVAQATEAVELSRKIDSTVAERVKAGKVSPLEKNRSMVELSMAKLDLQCAVNQLDIERTRLSSMWGSLSPEFVDAKGAFDAVPLSIPSVESIKGYLAGNLEIIRSGSEQDLYKAELELEKSAAVPDLSACAGIQQFEETGDSALAFGVAVALPVFDRNQGNIASAEYELSGAAEKKRVAEIKVHAELLEAYKKLSASHLEVLTLENEIMPSAEKALTAVQSGYRQGKFGYLDVLDTQRTMFGLRQKEIEAKSGYHKAVVKLERLIGRSLESLEN